MCLIIGLEGRDHIILLCTSGVSVVVGKRIS
jgi:hypothetical protein